MLLSIVHQSLVVKPRTTSVTYLVYRLHCLEVMAFRQLFEPFLGRQTETGLTLGAHDIKTLTWVSEGLCIFCPTLQLACEHVQQPVVLRAISESCVRAYRERMG